jgi:hypothetical protein
MPKCKNTLSGSACLITLRENDGASIFLSDVEGINFYEIKRDRALPLAFWASAFSDVQKCKCKC